MTKFLVKKFIKNHKDINDVKVRERYGRLAGAVGIITNTFISALKIFIGFFVNSIAVIADGVNNLTDAASSVITLVGFKLAARKGDKDHPFGHARFEYITGMVVSVMIIVVGLKLLTSSYEKIMDPADVEFNYYVIIILVISIGIKIWQAIFNVSLGKTINSSTLKATGTDSRNDVIATTAVLASILIGQISGYNVDGYMGVLVALFILYSGIQLIRETSSPLLGSAPDPMLVKEIEESINAYDGVLGVHDLVVHDYGPGKIFATVHIEVDAYADFLESHDIVDNIERQVGNKLGLDLVAHIDPIDTKNPLVDELNSFIGQVIRPIKDVVSFHDLRIVKGKTHTNIIFDLVLSVDNNESRKEISQLIQDKVEEKYPNFFVVISFDIDYTAG